LAGPTAFSSNKNIDSSKYQDQDVLDRVDTFAAKM
jgi:hypothetical protein